MLTYNNEQFYFVTHITIIIVRIVHIHIIYANGNDVDIGAIGNKPYYRISTRHLFDGKERD